MSYHHVQQLASIRDEYVAAEAAIAYLERTWHQMGDVPEVSAVRLAHVRDAARNLEATYVIRLFSEFEGLLQRHLAVRRPGRPIPRTTETLINRVALRERIPDPIRDAAHRVREYRNTVVHYRAAATPALTFRQATAALNRFLDPLPAPS